MDQGDIEDGAAAARHDQDRASNGPKTCRRGCGGGARCPAAPARVNGRIDWQIRAGTCRRAKGARERGLPRPCHLMRKVETFVADWLPSLIVTFTFSSLPFAFFGIINDTRATPALNCTALGSTLP